MRARYRNFGDWLPPQLLIYNFDTGMYELWRTDGTAGGTFLLVPSLYNLNYLNIIGNTALFVAGDAMNGYELWKSDNSLAGTALVKDINPGIENSIPGGMFIYKKEAYFSAYDGTTPNPSFWKSNGTTGGTTKLRDIDPYWDRTVALTERFFCISNNILYFSAIDHATTAGTVLWKTDGTIAGTQLVKDINPTSSAEITGPYDLTYVKGTLFFTADDGVHGREIWKSDGTATGTLLVKDITTGAGGNTMVNLTSFADKLFFKNAVDGRYYLWSSDGTEAGTKAVEDAGLVNVGIAFIFAARDKLFLSGDTGGYGIELYVGTVKPEAEKQVSFAVSQESKQITSIFNVSLFPNPASSKATLQIAGDTKNIFISISDMRGKKVWESNNRGSAQVSLPIEKFAAGIYLVTVTNGRESKTVKLVKQ